MAKQNEKKSTHLQGLEEAFEKRTRRFSAFAVLGLDKEGNGAESSSEDEILPERAAPSPSVESVPESSVSAIGKDMDHPHGDGIHTPVGVKHSHEGGNNTQGSTSHTYGGVTPIPGMGIHTKVVVNKSNTTTLDEYPHGDGYNTEGGGVHTYGGGIHPPDYDAKSEPLKLQVQESKKTSRKRSSPKKPPSTLPVADVVATANIRSQLGEKARQVLAYLNSVRSLEHDAFTVPIGYGQICHATGVDHHYLRRNVIPKLAMIGLLAVERKSLEGTIYRLQCSSGQVELITTDATLEQEQVIGPTLELPKTQEINAEIPEWIDKEQWGWLSAESVQKLIDRAGSEAKAKEKLDTLIYNETHGSPGQLVRNRRSVLAHYLRSPEAEIWPNDEGFETLEMQHAKLELAQAKKEKALAEQALATRLEARIVKFKASLSDAQEQWLKQESKRRVDVRPEAKLVSSRFPLYKAEEQDLISEWMERTEYGEQVPEGEG